MDQTLYLEIFLYPLELSAGEASVLYMDGTLPLLECESGYTEHLLDIETFLPLLSAELNVKNQPLANIDITFGWPSLTPWEGSFFGGGSLSGSFASLSSNFNTASGSLISIAGQINAPSALFNIVSETLGSINFSLPGISNSISVNSQVIGHITGAIPMFHWHGHGKTGNIGSFDLDLPLMYYDSILFHNGIIQLDIDLPCLITDASGTLSDATFSYRTIIMNTQNFGVTEYGDLTLTGMTDAFGHTLAINSTDLVRMGSALDDDQQIDASFKTGTLDFSDPYYMKPRDIWVTLRSGKKIRMTIINDEEGVPYTYDSENFVPNLRKTRIKIGRGYYDAFYDLEFSNIDGELIDIENIHVLSENITGRKR